MPKTVEIIRNRQRAWAANQGIVTDARGYTVSLGSNLYSPLLPETRMALESARSRELRDTAGQGRMRALDSSSALLVNFFEYWLNGGVQEIASMCGAAHPMTAMRFLPVYSSPLGDNSPRAHIDLEFTGTGPPLMVLSRFTETYFRFNNRNFGEPHLMDPPLWTELPRCGSLARQIGREDSVRASYAYLDAPRLLKHIVGLSSKCGVKGFQLLYLWYDFPSGEAERHREEISRFTDLVQDEVLFMPKTYQEIFDTMRLHPGVNPKYVSYLYERYFLKSEERSLLC